VDDAVSDVSRVALLTQAHAVERIVDRALFTTDEHARVCRARCIQPRTHNDHLYSRENYSLSVCILHSHNSDDNDDDVIITTCFVV